MRDRKKKTSELTEELASMRERVAELENLLKGSEETEEELRRTRDLLVETELIARIGSWSWEVDSGEVSWSPGMYRHYGLQPDEVDSPEELARSSIHPDDLPRLRDHMNRARESGRVETIEYRVRVGDSIRYHRTEGEVVRDANRGPVRMVGFVQDVTTLKEVEIERRRAEQERDRLFETSIDLLSVSDFEGSLRFVNPAWTRTLGFATAEMTGRAWLDFIHPEDRERALEAAARLKRGESVTGLENRYRHQDGTYRWFSSNARPLPDEELIFTVTRDITDERAARETLEREVLFRTSIVKRAAEGLAVCHETPAFPFVAFTVWNDRMSEITGYSKDEINRLGWYQTVYSDPEMREKAQARMALMREGADLHGEEWVITRKDGEARVLRISTSVVRGPDGGSDAAHVLALMDDVTERRRAEEALRESEERYRSFIEEAPYGIYRSTPDGRLLTVNRALAVMLGFDSSEELLGKTERELYQDQGEWGRFVADHLEKAGVRGVEVLWARRDGNPITVRLSGRPISGGGFEMICEDVTDRRLLEEQFRQAQKMEAVGRLAGGIAHDFNNLLTAVTGYADLLRVRMAPDDPRLGYVNEIGGAADRAASLTHQLLAFSRRQVLQPRVVELDGLVRSMERMLSRIIGEDVDLRTRLEGRGHVRADPSQLEQVLLNLVVNARDAMPGGGELTIEVTDFDASESFVRKRRPMTPGAYVLLAVTDTGGGIDRATMEQIFEPFYTTKEPGKGTGLGLATVYGVVKQSEGFIWANSTPGRGARFEIYLPRVEYEADGLVPSPNFGRASGTETVLLVEDEENVRRVLSEMLAWYGYDVIEARDATEAVARARSRTGAIDLLVTDVVMPRVGGRALVEAVSEHRPGIPVLYISGYVGTGATASLLEDGAAFLPKPFTAAAFARKVREVLGPPSES